MLAQTPVCSYLDGASQVDGIRSEGTPVCSYLDGAFEVDGGGGEVPVQDVLRVQRGEPLGQVVQDGACTGFGQRHVQPGQEVLQVAAAGQFQANQSVDNMTQFSSHGPSDTTQFGSHGPSMGSVCG